MLVIGRSLFQMFPIHLLKEAISLIDHYDFPFSQNELILLLLFITFFHPPIDTDYANDVFLYKIDTGSSP